MAVRLGYDVRLLTRVCQRFATRVMQCLRRRVRRERDLPSVGPLAPGVMIVVQRFRNDLSLYVHLHALVTDGCFVTHGENQGEPRLASPTTPGPAEPALAPRAATSSRPARFLPIDSLDQRDLSRVLSAVHRDLVGDDPDGDDVDDALAACVTLGASCASPPPAVVSPRAAPMTVSAHGMQLHAATTVDGRDRRRLERVCKYLLRPAFAHDAVVAMPDGNVRIHFKRATRTGATFTTITRDAFLARLCALVPPPKFHMVRYYGVLAPAHAIRPAIIPQTPILPPPKQLAMFLPSADVERIATSPDSLAEQVRVPSPSRIAWARLLARVFAIDVERCQRCGGPMRVVAAVTDVDEIAAHLQGARAPPVPSPPGQSSLFAR